jgi:deoxyhypusine monooxygenase
MVRHEAAEALGSIATDDVLPVLREYAQKGPRVVRESCVVALDMYEVGHDAIWQCSRSHS